LSNDLWMLIARYDASCKKARLKYTKSIGAVENEKSLKAWVKRKGAVEKTEARFIYFFLVHSPSSSSRFYLV
jgi:hypothetical protein